MCTVVVRWAPGAAVELLALRDERVGRAFDDPGAWWPEQPHVVGGRDRLAGGTWCATDVARGTTALVLNRSERPLAVPGAPSRGVLPLVALAHGEAWAEHVDVTGMAGFTLVLAAPSGVVHWAWDGTTLVEGRLAPGTAMFTAGPQEQGRSARHLPSFAAAEGAAAWQALVAAAVPGDDPADLLVQHRHGDAVFATVFAQVLVVEPGRLALRSSRTPSDPASWTAGAHRA